MADTKPKAANEESVLRGARYECSPSFEEPFEGFGMDLGLVEVIGADGSCKEIGDASDDWDGC